MMKPIATDYTSKTLNSKKKNNEKSLKKSLQEPLYVQVARIIREEIVNGIYPVGSFLPSEAKLCEQFSVSRSTLREALKRLIAENLISSRRGARRVVLPPQPSESNFLHALSIDDVLTFSASNWQFNIKSIEMDCIDKSLSEWLDLTTDQDWLAVRGSSRTRDAEFPECWVEFFIHQDFAAVSRLLHRHSSPVFPLIEDMFGEKVVELTQDISASLIPPYLATELQVEPGGPAIVVRRMCKTSEGKIMEANIETYPASRFRYSLTLHRS